MASYGKMSRISRHFGAGVSNNNLSTYCTEKVLRPSSCGGVKASTRVGSANVLEAESCRPSEEVSISPVSMSLASPLGRVQIWLNCSSLSSLLSVRFQILSL